MTYKASPLLDVENKDQNGRGGMDLPSGSAPDFEISQLQSSIRLLENQDRPKATKTHERRGNVETENKQHRENARQKEINNLDFFRRVHILPAQKLKKSINMAHWISNALTQKRSATPFQNPQR